MQRTLLFALGAGLLFVTDSSRAADPVEPSPTPPVRHTIIRAAPGSSPVPRSARPESIPSDIFEMLTPGVERFVVGGLALGAGPQAVQQFLDAKGLHPVQTGANPLPDSLLINHGLQRVSYTRSCVYTNDKTGAAKLEVKLTFTPPFPSSEGYVSRVSGINYTTYFGAGVKYGEIKSGLVERFGTPADENPSNGSLGWNTFPIDNRPIAQNSDGTSSGPEQFYAQVSPPDASDNFCKLELWISDANFNTRSVTLAQASESPTAADKPQDMTKPSY